MGRSFIVTSPYFFHVKTLVGWCIDEDFSGNWLLNVPLGKMSNERIIPLDPALPLTLSNGFNFSTVDDQGLEPTFII